jgi:hypothetical protein
MAIVIESPNELYSFKSESNVKLFLAGSMINYLDWQSKVIESLSNIDNLTIFNPRRNNQNINDYLDTEKQIIWKFKKLKESNIIAFWFSKGCINPIILYELGYWIGKRPIVIGIDKEYQKREQIIIQAKLSGYEEEFDNDIESFVESIKSILCFQ